MRPMQGADNTHPLSIWLLTVSLTGFPSLEAHGPRAYAFRRCRAFPNSRLALRSNSLRRTGSGVKMFESWTVVPRYMIISRKETDASDDHSPA